MANNGFNVKIGSILDTSGAEKAIGKLTKSIQTAVKTSSGEVLTKQMNTYVKAVEQADGTVRKYTKTFTSLLNSQGQYVDIKGRVLKQQGEELVKQEQTTKAVKSTTQAIKANTDALQEQGNTASKVSDIFKRFGESLAKIAYLKLANEALSLFTTACNEARDAILDLDNAIVEFNKVSDLNETGNLQQYIEELGELGQTVARTQSEMLEGATEFVKSGYSEEDAKNLSQINALLQNVADSEMSADEAANVIISTMKAFNIEAKDTVHIVDAINETSNHYAVSSTDLSDGLANVASTADAAGNSMEQTLGMLTAMVEITQSASKSSRGLEFV
jgi:RNase P/RNase MRP subunit p29